MSLWLLLVDRNDQGLAVPVSFPRHPFSRHPAGKIPIIDVSIQPDEGQALWESAKKAAKQCGALLWREGYLNESGTIRFCRGAIKHGDLEANDSQGDSMGIQGSSADLLFALAFLTVAVGRGYPPLAATGALGEGAENGWVQSVKGVPAKITAALQVLPVGSLLFYPKANHNDIPPDLHKQADAQGVTLIAVERLEEALVRLGITIEKVYLDTPYLGLQSFSYAERSIFFGREAAIEDLQTLLLQREQAGKPGVLIVAASGAGKSSLAQAGLLPALEKAGWPQTDSDNPPKPLRLALAARQVYWTETWKPQLATERSVAGLLRSIIDNWATQPLLQALPPVDNLAQLADALVATAPKERRFLWLIDQLEELFTLSFPYDAIDAFADFLQRLQQQGVWLVSMLRNDFYPRYQEHEATEPWQARLIDVFGGAHYDLLKPDEAALRRIIEWPAEKAGLSFETDADGSTLADHIAQDLREGGVDALPLLQFALRQLWDGRESGQNILTFKAYQAMGRLHGAIGQKAETVYQSLEPAVQAALPKLLWDLTNIYQASNGVKEYKTKKIAISNYSIDSKGWILIDAFTSPTVRLLVKDGPTVYIAHKAVLNHWHIAQKVLVNELEQDMLIRERLEQNYQRWVAKEQSIDFLLTTTKQLKEGGDWLKRCHYLLSNEELVTLAHYIKLSEKHHQSVQTKRKYILLTVTFSVIVVILVAAHEHDKATTFAMKFLSDGKEDNDLAVEHWLSGNTTKASRSFEKVLENINVASDYLNIQDCLSLPKISTNYASLLLVDGKNSQDKEKGQKISQKILSDLEKIASQNSDNQACQKVLLDVYSQFGKIAITNRDAKNAYGYYDKARIVLEKLVQRFPNDYKTKLSKNYGSLSWSSLLNRQFNDAIKYAKLGLELDPSQSWIECNIAHALLFSGKEDEAIKEYKKIAKLDFNGQNLYKIVKKDFHEMTGFGFDLSNMANVESIINASVE